MKQKYQKYRRQKMAKTRSIKILDASDKLFQTPLQLVAREKLTYTTVEEYARYANAPGKIFAVDNPKPKKPS